MNSNSDYLETLSSTQRAVNWVLVALLGFGSSIVLMLGIVLAMFANTLLPHVIEFCVLAWQAVSTQIAYRLMFLGFVVLALSVFTFLVRVWWHAHLTKRHIHELLLNKQTVSTKLARVLEQLALTSQVDLVAAEYPFAFCYGWHQPRILVTTSLVESLNGLELKSVLAHEKYHLTQRDPFKILVARALRDAFVFFPLLHDLVENYLVLQEIAADKAAIEAGATRDALASALLKVFRSPTWDNLGVGAYTTFGERVHYLANPQRRFVWRYSWLRAVITLGSVILIFLAILHPMSSMALGAAFDMDCHRVATVDLDFLRMTWV